MSGALGQMPAPQLQTPGQPAPVQATGSWQHTPVLTQVHDQARARFDATSKATKSVDQFQSGLGALSKMGDSVTPEDVIQEAGKLVAGGQDPATLAGFLADMPSSGGQALAGWVEAHLQTVQQAEAQTAAAHGQARHALGVSALHGLIAHSLNPQSAAPA